jgi:hypothetical protein
MHPKKGGMFWSGIANPGSHARSKACNQLFMRLSWVTIVSETIVIREKIIFFLVIERSYTMYSRAVEGSGMEKVYLFCRQNT